MSTAKEKPTQELNPKTQHYEFLGPIGAFGMTFALPILVLFFASCCDSTGYPSQHLFADWKGYLQSKLTLDYLVSVFSLQDLLIYCGFVGMLALFYFILPGDNIPGTLLRDGTRLKYKMNGMQLKKVICITF